MVSLISIVLSEARLTDPVENLTLTASAPVENALTDVVSPIDDIYHGIADRGDLVRENQELRAELERLRAQIAAQQDIEQRIAELEDVLDIKEQRPEDQLLAANVIAEDPSGLKRMIAVDRGINDGIDEGMTVLSREGSLVGTVARAYDDYSWIRLVTDSDHAVNAQVNVTAVQPGAGPTPEVLTPDDQATTTPTATPTPTPDGETQEASPSPSAESPTPSPLASEEPDSSTARGVVTGDLGSDLLFDLLPAGVVIEPGSLVVTSGLGGNYPPGILIGQITTVEERPQSALQRARVLPTAPLSSLETVLVLISFEPARLEEAP